MKQDKDLTPTAVVKRPLEAQHQQEDFFCHTTKYASFRTTRLTRVRLSAAGRITAVTPTTITAYCELPNMTVFIKYSGLSHTYARVGEDMKEAAVIALADGLVKLRLTRITDGEPVAPEFFHEEPQDSNEGFHQIGDDGNPEAGWGAY